VVQAGQPSHLAREAHGVGRQPLSGGIPGEHVGAVGRR
jgi:hypothetical protein